ncbi:MAG: hypothetical protein H7Y11_09065 [Armatimonadetes bacterium]|nr:hypothetical protein [Anaerolineae bacterium]
MLKALRLSALLALVLASLLATTVRAQDAAEYGDVFEGEMTEDEYEFEITFEGEEGDIIALVLTPIIAEDAFISDLTSPIMMLEFDGDTVADTTSQFVFGGPLSLVTVLEDSGEYTLFITREDGSSGDSVGEFEVAFNSVEILEIEEPVTGSAETDGGVNYYAVQSDSDWGISYLKADGDLDVEIAINRLDENSSGLTRVAYASGSELTEAAFGILEGGDVYIVTVGEPAFAFSFSPEDAEFQLELLPFE